MRDNFQVFDAHMHYTGIFMKPYENLIEYMDAYGIDKAVVNTLNIEANMGVLKEDNPILANLNESNYCDVDVFSDFRNGGQPDHTYLKKLQDIAPDRIYPFFWYNPADPNDKEQIKGLNTVKEALNDGFKGVKLQMAMLPTEIEALYPLAELLLKHDLPLYIHPSAGVCASKRTSPFNLVDLIKSYPQLKIIIGHSSYTMEFCIECVFAFSKLTAYNQNLYFESSLSVPFGIISYTKVFGADHVIFGSDSPPAGPWEIEFSKINLLKLPDDAKKMIFYDNIARILKIEETQ